MDGGDNAVLSAPPRDMARGAVRSPEPALTPRFGAAPRRLHSLAMREDPIIAPQQLPSLPDPALLDARSGPKAKAAYAAQHLAGARFIDLDHDLAAHPDDPAQGGRHPLPAPAAFAAALARLGLDPTRPVVVYDDQGGANAAARAWWMLRSVGFPRVYVLDGGLKAALAAGLPTESGEPDAAPELHAQSIDRYARPQATLEDVDARRLDPSFRVLDVRAATRYRGEQEPIDPIAGHIPGAVNLPLSENLDAEGRFKDAAALRAQYEALLGDVPPERLIVHCGSGVTACHTLLALERAGLTGAALYVGSWSEWCRRDMPRGSSSPR
jgi:thiosulfate/3-mercaptopyruvate sulfurtransferase